MRILLLVALLSFGTSVTAQNSITPIKLPELESMLQKGDKLKVINFWASWCGPCVKELPYFESLSEDESLDVRLVSLDFIQDQAKAQKLIEKKGISLTTYLLDEKHYIEAIEDSWTGTIPATLIIDTTGERYFYEHAFTEEELNKEIKNIITK